MNEFPPWIAVVDDDESIRRALVRLLRSTGIEAMAFGSGTEFLAVLHASQPACVVLDLNMPAMSGFEVQARLARDNPDIPVIIITGQDSPEMWQRAMLTKPVAYLLKPMNDETLLEAIRQAAIKLAMLRHAKATARMPAANNLQAQGS
jgi:FixJ family two-component response regulator